MLRRHSLAVPWPRSSSPLVFKPAWLICHHLGKEERKQTSSSVPNLLHFEEEMAGKPRFRWEKRPLKATAGRAHLQLQVDKYLQRFSPRPALGGPLKPCSRPPALSDLPPHCRGSHSAFQLPGGARSNRVGRVIFPGLASRFPACRALSERHRFLPRSPGPEALAASERCPGLRPARTRTALHAAVARV